MVEPPTHKSARHQPGWGLSVRTKGEVTKLLTSLDFLAFLDGSLDTTYHHSADTHGHDAPKGRAINRNDLADVFAVNVESRSYGLGLCSPNEIMTNSGKRS